MIFVVNRSQKWIAFPVLFDDAVDFYVLHTASIVFSLFSEITKVFKGTSESFANAKILLYLSFVFFSPVFGLKDFRMDWKFMIANSLWLYYWRWISNPLLSFINYLCWILNPHLPFQIKFLFPKTSLVYFCWFRYCILYRKKICFHKLSINCYVGKY